MSSTNNTGSCDIDNREVYCYPEFATCVYSSRLELEVFLLVCVFLLSLISCILLIYVVYKTKSTSIALKVYIISLACAHLLSTWYSLPIMTYSLFFPQIAIAYPVCTTATMVILSTVIFSNYTLAIISFDRFLTIFRPFHYPIVMSRRKSFAVVLITCFIAVTFAVPPYLGWGGLRYCFQPRKLQICGVDWKSSTLYTYLSWFTNVIMPLLAMLFCYLKIACLARSLVEPSQRLSGSTQNRQKQQRTAKLQSSNRDRSIKSSLKTFKIVFINIATIVACWCPYTIIGVRNLSTPGYLVSYELDLFAYCLLFLPNFLNPVVFIAFNEDYRHCVQRLWSRITLNRSRMVSSTVFEWNSVSTAVNRYQSGTSGYLQSTANQNTTTNGQCQLVVNHQ